jgi:hypothetical protein
MPSISVSQQVWEQLQRESQRRRQSINGVLGELLGLPTTTAEKRPQERTPIKTFREAIVVALGQLGGRATKRQVLTALPSIVVLTSEDIEKDRRGNLRWEVQAGQAASQLRRSGTLKITSHGIWALATAPYALGTPGSRSAIRAE